jgi:hypothetical protein
METLTNFDFDFGFKINNIKEFVPTSNALKQYNSNPKTHLKKTEICIRWKETEFCKYGENCNFAHGFTEKQEKDLHNKHKTTLCKGFHEDNGNCPYGVRCSFIHTKKPLSYSEIFSINSDLCKVKCQRLKSFQKRTEDYIEIEKETYIESINISGLMKF